MESLRPTYLHQNTPQERKGQIMTEPHETTSEDTVNLDFEEFLAELGRGSVTTEMGEKLKTLIEAVQATKKQGTLTLKLTVGWDKGSDMIRVSNQVAAKNPMLPRAESLFFVTDDGLPSRQDPRQLELELANQRRREEAKNVVDFTEPRRTTN